MEDAAHALAVRAQRGDQLGVRVAVVQDDGQIQLARQAELRDQRLVLHVSWGEVAIEVQPNLADGDDGRSAGQRALLGQGLRREGRRVVRVGADGGEDAAGVVRRQRQRVAARLHIDTGHDQPPHAVGKRRGEHLVAVRSELAHLDVRMGIYQHRQGLRWDDAPWHTAPLPRNQLGILAAQHSEV